MSRCVTLATRVLAAGRFALASCHSASRVRAVLNTRPTRAHTLLAVGKAACAMAVGACAQLGSMRGLVVSKEIGAIPHGVELILAGHPRPDARSVIATQRAIELVAKMHADDELLVLISGGTSALLGGPVDGVSLQALRETTEQLLRSGASIDEINRVRRRLGAALGGRLLAATPARVRALVVSDVMSGDLRTIGSGPLHADAPTCEETARLDAEIIASPATWLAAAIDALEATGLRARGELFVGTVETLVARLIERAHALAPGEAFALVGEPAVTVTGSGTGGRAQHAALALIEGLSQCPDTAALALASDGSDGPTDAAGGLVHAETASLASRLGVDMARALADHDSHTALAQLSALVSTGPTGTNLTDLYVVARD